MKRTLLLCTVLFIVVMSAVAQEPFCIAKDGKAAAIVVDEQDWKGVIRAANNLSDDIRRVAPSTVPEGASIAWIIHRS